MLVGFGHAQTNRHSSSARRHRLRERGNSRSRAMRTRQSARQRTRQTRFRSSKSEIRKSSGMHNTLLSMRQRNKSNVKRHRERNKANITGRRFGLSKEQRRSKRLQSQGSSANQRLTKQQIIDKSRFAMRQRLSNPGRRTNLLTNSRTQIRPTKRTPAASTRRRTGKNRPRTRHRSFRQHSMRTSRRNLNTNDQSFSNHRRFGSSTNRVVEGHF